MNALESVNQAWFLQLNADLSTVSWKLNIAAVMADYLIYLIPLVLIASWCWGNESQRDAALKACVVTFAALGIAQIVGFFWPHPRPFMMGIGHTFIPHASDSSFPSDHATVFAGVALTLLFANWRSFAAWVLLALGTCVAWARIFLGVHFPLDMAGAVLVVLIAWMAVTPMWRRLGKTLTKRTTGIYRVLLAHPIALGWVRQ
jgi:undecaprenyl-diphosphatase